MRSLHNETYYEAKLRDGVRDLGGLCLKFVSPGFVGVPDRIILLPGGSILFAEMKAPGKTERPRQKYVHTLLRRLGFKVYAAVDSVEKIEVILDNCRERITKRKEVSG